jgi:hypothetical protein
VEFCLSKWILIATLIAGLARSQTQVAAPENARPAPTREEQRRILIAVSNYAEQYVDSLPNFICDQTTQQFEAGRKPKKWHQLDSLTSKLVFNKGREERSLELVNGRPVSAHRRVRTPLTSEGEFGILLREIFDPSTDTGFSWSNWETVDGHPVAVLNFSIDKSHSTLKLTGEMGSGIAPYRGSVTVDPQTGEIWKVTDAAFDIPPIVQTESIATTIVYGRVTIGEHSFLLPTHATVLLNTGDNNIRNEMSFDDYRKFESDSKITFTAVDSHDNSPVSSPPLSPDF